MYPSNIFLVGLMGSGKTTVGKLLAKKTGKDFIDSDEEIARRNGVDIATIFEIEGEDGFREREQAVIAELSLRSNLVLATGGGSVLRAENRRNLASKGFVIYLEANVETLFRRTKNSKSRPLLQVDNPRKVLRGLLKIRGPLYLEVADARFNTQSHRSASAMVKNILQKLESL